MPAVSIIVPCYNEQHTISLLLDAIFNQTYPQQDMEVIVADGMSTDQTRAEIAQFQQTHPEMLIRVVDNPKRHIPSALNRALEQASGQYIIRLDAHAIPAKDYVTRCVNALEQGLGDNVGGVWQIAPGQVTPPEGGHPSSRAGWLARSIATAAAHPLGVGDALYRHTTQAQYVDTVPFGAFRRLLIEKIGPFDESLLTNEDYEFNVRVRQAGGKVWLDPAIRSTYLARSTLSALARQYARYGFWKAQMLRRYPETIRWRQAIPPGFVLSLIVISLLAFVAGWARGLLLFEIAVYFLALFVASIQKALQLRDLPLLIGLPFAIATMHICWGGAFLWSLLLNRANA